MTGLFTGVLTKTNADTIADDPCSMVYSQLIESAMANPTVNAMVKANNVCRFDYAKNETFPIKDDISTDDLPELTLVPTNYSHVKTSSCHSTVTVIFQWQIATGDWRLSVKLFPLLHHLTVAMNHVSRDLSKLEYNGAKFFLSSRVGDGVCGIDDPTANRNIRGWSATLPITVQMKFPYYLGEQ